jgi:hypothetical protein
VDLIALFESKTSRKTLVLAKIRILKSILKEKCGSLWTRCIWLGTNVGRGMYIGYWWGKPKGKRLLERPISRWVDNIKMYFRWDGVMWTGLIWLRIGTSGGLL